MYDVIIIGARCAGSPTAMLLARAGLRVLLLDRVSFPSDTVSTHYLHPAGVARLNEWGLLPALLKTGCPPVEEMTFDLADDVVVRGAPLPVAGSGMCLAPRRTVLDELLVRAAVDAGAELRTGASFRTPLWEEGRVAGVRFAADGQEFTERAGLVIGADGRHSPLARSVDAAITRDLGVISCLFYGYWSGLPDKGSQVFVRDGRAVVAFPTHDNQHCVVVGWDRDRFDEVKRDISRHFLTAVAELAPEVHEHLVQGERHGRIVGSGDLANFYRESAGPGWALVGDAGHTKDPASAQGIGDAFAQAASIAERVPAALGQGPAALDQAVRSYAARRADERSLDRFATNAAFAQWSVPDSLLGVLRTAQHDPEQASRFLGVYAGQLSLADFVAAN